jgi:hypothetical protein
LLSILLRRKCPSARFLRSCRWRNAACQRPPSAPQTFSQRKKCCAIHLLENAMKTPASGTPVRTG